MTGSKSDYLELKLLDLALGAVAWTPPATWYARLYTVAPGEAGGGTEANYASYAAVAITNNLTNFPSGNPKSNGTLISFPKATGDQTGNIVAVALWDQASGGNMGPYSTLAVPKPVFSGDTPNFPAGTLTLTED